MWFPRAHIKATRMDVKRYRRGAEVAEKEENWEGVNEGCTVQIAPSVVCGRIYARGLAWHARPSGCMREPACVRVWVGGLDRKV